jgi:hypothetical protein
MDEFPAVFEGHSGVMGEVLMSRMPLRAKQAVRRRVLYLNRAFTGQLSAELVELIELAELPIEFMGSA